MKKFFHIVLFWGILFTAIPLFAHTPKVAGEGPLGLTVGLEYLGKHLHRGVYDYDKDGAFVPFISYNVLDTGLNVTFSAMIADDYIFEGKKHNDAWRDLNITNLGLDYEHNFGLVTLGAGVLYFGYWDNDLSYMESHISIAFDELFLSPTIIFTHDYHFHEKLWEDFYIQFGISHTFGLLEKASLTLGAIAGYFNFKSEDKSGISDIDLSAELAVAAGAVTCFAGFHYVIVPSKDFWHHDDIYSLSHGREKKDISRFYSRFGVAYTF